MSPADRSRETRDARETRRSEAPESHDAHERPSALSAGHRTAGEALRLTAYFGERMRARGRLLADEMLDACARHAIHTSVLLRGIQGFGAKHRLRTDRLLTLSEDLPLVAIAVDRCERIEALHAEVEPLLAHGLLTVERCHMSAPADENGGFERSDLDGPDRSELKLTVHLGRHERIDGEPAFAAACRTLHEAGVAGATVLLGVDGTVDGARRRARFLARNVGVPMIAISVGSRESVLSAAARLSRLLESPTMTFERVRVHKRDGKLLLPRPQAPPGDFKPTEGDDALPGDDQSGERGPDRVQLTRLTVIVSEATRHAKRPVYAELVRRLRAADAAGATALRGIWGFHGDHAPHGDRLLAIRRHVPVAIVAIDTPERIADLFPLVDELTAERGLVTSESVPAPAATPTPPGSLR